MNNNKYPPQVLGGQIPALDPLKELNLHLDVDLLRLADVDHRVPRPSLRVEGRGLGGESDRRCVHGEWNQRAGPEPEYLEIPLTLNKIIFVQF